MDSGTGGCGGKPRKIVSDETVEELESPYEYAGEYDGEIYFADGRENVTGHAAAYTRETPFALEPTLTEVRLQDEMPVRGDNGAGRCDDPDFGQNFAGIVEIDPSFLKNETITIRHGEILNADGSLYTANLRKSKGDDRLPCRCGEEKIPPALYLYGISLYGTFRCGISAGDDQGHTHFTQR